MRLFAISDLHLSLGVDKPMDIFGPQWVGHGERIQRAWDDMVGPEDWVFVGGDTSWGLTLDQALPEVRQSDHRDYGKQAGNELLPSLSARIFARQIIKYIHSKSILNKVARL